MRAGPRLVTENVEDFERWAAKSIQSSRLPRVVSTSVELGGATAAVRIVRWKTRATSASQR